MSDSNNGFVTASYVLEKRKEANKSEDEANDDEWFITSIPGLDEAQRIDDVTSESESNDDSQSQNTITGSNDNAFGLFFWTSGRPKMHYRITIEPRSNMKKKKVPHNPN